MADDTSKSPTLTKHARCTFHPHTPLTVAGECPRCGLAPAMAEQRPNTKHIPRPPTNTKKQVAAQIHGRISAGKPRARRAA